MPISVIPGEAIIVGVLKVVELAMEGQTPEQRSKMWDWYIRDVERWRAFLKLDAPVPPQKLPHPRGVATRSTK